jgi:hypothetical protein
MGRVVWEIDTHRPASVTPSFEAASNAFTSEVLPAPEGAEMR